MPLLFTGEFYKVSILATVDREGSIEVRRNYEHGILPTCDGNAVNFVSVWQSDGKGWYAFGPKEGLLIVASDKCKAQEKQVEV